MVLRVKRGHFAVMIDPGKQKNFMVSEKLTIWHEAHGTVTCSAVHS